MKNSNRNVYYFERTRRFPKDLVMVFTKDKNGNLKPVCPLGWLPYIFNSKLTSTEKIREGFHSNCIPYAIHNDLSFTKLTTDKTFPLIVKIEEMKDSHQSLITRALESHQQSKLIPKVDDRYMQKRKKR